jgi:hypothetical protein
MLALKARDKITLEVTTGEFAAHHRQPAAGMVRMGDGGGTGQWGGGSRRLPRTETNRTTF